MYSKTKRLYALLFIMVMVATTVAACGKKEETKKQTELHVFAAASLKSSMEQIIADYEKEHSDVKVILSADSSGTLLTQIQEGYECDIFFSAATKQVDQLEKDGLIRDGVRKEVLNNQVVLIKGKNAKTEVTSLKDLNKAKSFALAAASVPVGKYTREALKNIGILDKSMEASDITTKQVSEALGGLEISEQGNVSKVLLAVAEGSCEVGTVYLSDTYGYGDKVDIIEKVPNTETGKVIYPACLVVNKEADDLKKQASKEFFDYMTGDKAMEVYKQHYFDTDSTNK